MLNKTLKNIALTISLAALSACSAYSPLGQADGIPVDKVDSASVTIQRAALQNSETGLLLRGELKRKAIQRGPMPGHLHVELLDIEGKVFRQTSLGYRRLGVKSRLAGFALSIPQSNDTIGRVRVIHHDLKSHSAEQASGTWSDVISVQ